MKITDHSDHNFLAREAEWECPQVTHLPQDPVKEVPDRTRRDRPAADGGPVGHFGDRR